MPQIVIVLEGGVVQHTVASEPMDVVVIDYDTEGGDTGDITQVPQDDGDTAEAYVTEASVYVNAARAAELVKLA